MEKLGVGIIGCGNISEAYLRLAPLFAGIELRAVADINPDAARARADQFGVRAETVEGLLAADDVQIVVNLTIPAAHCEVSTAVLESGKHVYSEKPFVLSRDEGLALQKLADDKGLRVGSAPDTFLGGAHQAARAALDSGRIGKVVAGTAHVMSRGMEHWHPNPDFFFQPGAGPVLDIGPYYITNLVQLIGPVARVSALSSSAFAERTILSEPRKGEKIPVGTPTNIHALLEFHSGATVTLSASWDVMAHRHGPMELYGTEGTLYVPDPNFFGGTVELARSGDDVVALDAGDHPFAKVNDRDHANYRAAGLADMAQAIRNGRRHRCSLELALHVVDVMTSILRAGETRQSVEIETRCQRPDALDAAAATALLATAPEVA